MKTQMLPLGVLPVFALGLTGCALQKKTLTLDLGEGVAMELVRMPAGQFVMGSPESEPGRHDNQGPPRTVKIARPFYVARHELTQAQWQAVMGDNPSWYKGDDLPVNRVSWLNAQEFCQRLSQHVQRTVRLPSEAEWEYACRADTTSAYSFGDSIAELDRYAWCDGNAPRKPSPVQRKEPNPWGLYDTHGNVWEWCEDIYHPNYEGAPSDGSAWVTESDPPLRRVLRGGSWFNKPPMLRSAFRLRRPSVMRSGYIGFRVVVETE